LLLDGSRKISLQDKNLFSSFKNKAGIICVNKQDMPQQIDDSDIKALADGKAVIKISALKSQGLANLERKIIDLAYKDTDFDMQAPFLTNLRHIQAIERSLTSLNKVSKAIQAGFPADFILLDLKEAIRPLDNLLGEQFQADMLERIFSNFCIGK
jgi:tRNA modification GTPase